MTTYSTDIKLSNVRLSFPSLFTKKVPVSGNEAHAQFQATFILDKTIHAAQIEQINKIIDDLIKTNKANRAGLKNICFLDGDVFKDLDKYPEYANSYVLVTKSFERPVVLNKDRSPIQEEDKIVYSGCYVNCVFKLHYYNNTSKGINGKLRGVQFYKEGDAFGQAPLSANSFDNIKEGDDLF